MSDILAQEEIEKMLKDAGHIKDEEAAVLDTNLESYLTKEEQDILGETGNICMGASANTLCTLLGKAVSITTPSLSVHTLQELIDSYDCPVVLVEVEYIEGVMGNNLLILKREDVALITDILLGGDGQIDAANAVMDELHISAIQEVMNQMVGASATSLAKLISKMVNIAPPTARELMAKGTKLESELIKGDDIILKTAFKMEIEGLLTSEIMQVFPMEFAKDLSKQVSVNAEVLLGVGNSNAEAVPAPADATPAPAAQAIVPEAIPQGAVPGGVPQKLQHSSANVLKEGRDQQVKNVVFPQFSSDSVPDAFSSENIKMLMDVPMKVTVGLGKTTKPIKDILDLNIGSVVMLERLAGDAVDVFVNGKLIGKGEVVVIDDNYGVRITELNVLSPESLV